VISSFSERDECCHSRLCDRPKRQAGDDSVDALVRKVVACHLTECSGDGSTLVNDPGIDIWKRGRGVGPFIILASSKLESHPSGNVVGIFSRRRFLQIPSCLKARQDHRV
jgi:hypothetical protein